MEFLTVDEIATMLKASHEFVYKNRRLFGGIKVGRLVRFPKIVFEKMIEEVMNNGDVPDRQAVVLRLQGERPTPAEGGIQNPKRSARSRGKGKTFPGDDKFGLYQALRVSLERVGVKKDE